MAGTVTSNLTRITAAEVGDDAGWEVIGGGQADAQNAEIIIQGIASRGRRVDNAIRGFSFDNASGIDLDAVNTLLGWWVNVLQPGSIGTTDNLEVRVGSNTSPTTDWDGWEVLTAITYPDIGGWIRVWVAINEITPDNGAGTPNYAALLHFGLAVDMGDVAGNAPNVLCDAIDYLDGGGIALLLDAGTAPSPATFSDFVTADEGNSTNKYGIVQTREGIIYCAGRLGIGDATLTVFNDSAFILIFTDQSFVNSDTMGITIELANASTDIDFADGVIKSAGAIQGDLVVTGTSGDCDFDGMTLESLRTIDLTSVCSLINSVIRMKAESLKTVSVASPIPSLPAQ